MGSAAQPYSLVFKYKYRETIEEEEYSEKTQKIHVTDLVIPILSKYEYKYAVTAVVTKQ